MTAIDSMTQIRTSENGVWNELSDLTAGVCLFEVEAAAIAVAYLANHRAIQRGLGCADPNLGWDLDLFAGTG